MTAPEAGNGGPSQAERLAAEIFSVEAGHLLVGGVRLADIAARHGTPLYVYDAAVMRRNHARLARALAGLADIHYSIKANPNPAVVAVFLAEGAGVEIASLGEYRIARAAGAAPGRILFAGPGKRRAELAAVMADGIGEIHLESFEEIARIEALAGGTAVPVAIRVNPVAEVQGGAMRMGGRPAPFGFDEEDLDAVVDRVAASSCLKLTGVHMFAGTQILDADMLAAQWTHGLAVARRVAARIGRPLDTIDLGGGLGIPYFAGEKPLDLDRLASHVPTLKAEQAADPLIRAARIVVEPGRFLVGPAGVYVAGVLAAKRSRGARFLVTDGGMHHHLAASGNLGQVIKRDYPLLAPDRVGAASAGPASVVGPLCTPLDTIARKAELPDLDEGDLVAVLQSGAYGLTASPVHFLGHPAPKEVLVDNGTVRLVGGDT
ncbi:type III PLP-dependent enzyme [Phreatobacter sp. AB_2022a]|uniref:type III PLP-dependent enzyme n=1 Tax=Phreatobacter sp. AB_2022a TaxID=3003134 RepID=UPI002286D2FA|nr:type III PLP-dependent enzyme [Phreatobacter sp. AB_2022a]MCZ0736254.1 type III PLP-dependent enzyme [Phreatobacter sp. AB_2022a]